MIKIAIVENDDGQALALEECVKKFSRENNLECRVEKFSNGIDFVTDYGGDADAVFMDIDMPLMDGMTAAKKLRERDTGVNLVFVTNLAQYALEGYKVNALDYLIKPVGYFEVELELKKILRMHGIKEGEFLWVTAEGAARRIPLMSVKFVESVKHDIHIHTLDGVYTFRGTLKDTEEKLKSAMFFRCHNCYIVNMNYVSMIDGDELTVEPGGDKVYVSRKRRKEFLEALTSYASYDGGGYALRGGRSK